MDEDLLERRKRSGMTQFQAAQASGISRVKLSMAETRQLVLSGREKAALRNAVDGYIRQKTRELTELMREEDREAASV